MHQYENCLCLSAFILKVFILSFSLRTVCTTPLVLTVHDVKMVSLAMQGMGQRMIAKNAHVNHPRQLRTYV